MVRDIISLVNNDVDDMLMLAFTDWMRGWGAAKRTVTDRAVVVRAFLRECPDVAQHTEEAVMRWIAERSGSAWTRSTYFTHFRSFYTWAVSAGVIDCSPLATTRRPRGAKPRPRPLTADESRRVLARATGDRRAWITLALYAGLRAHEVAKIRGEDIDGDTLYVRGKGGKDAMLPVHPEVAALARAYPRVGYWFPSASSATGHVSRHTVSTSTSRLFELCGIEGGLHRARHAYGTTLLRSGANIRVVQTLMRHESLATTAAYLAVDADEQAAAVAALSFAA